MARAVIQPAAPAAPSAAEHAAPMAPQSMEETGPTSAFVADLALKVLYEKGQTTAADLADALALPLPKILAPILDYLKKESLVEVKGGSGVAAATYMYVLSQKGADRAKEVMDRNGYVGPAPVTLSAYVARVRSQSIGEVSISFDALRKALSHLVLPERTLRQLGPAINSGRSIFLFGPPGTGKSSIAESLAGLLKGSIVVPYAVLVGQQIILVDEPFLRRIQYKIEIKAPTDQEFAEILRRVCEAQKITFYPKAGDWIAQYCRERNIALRSCHPRDLMQHLGAAGRFLLKQPELTPELVELACETYFVPI